MLFLLKRSKSDTFNLQVYRVKQLGAFWLFFGSGVWTQHVVWFFPPRGIQGPWDYRDWRAYLELR